MKKKLRFMAVLLAVFMMLSSLSVSAAVHEDGECLEHFEGYVDMEGVYLEFTPESSGWYEFYTSDEELDTYATLYDSDWNVLDYSDDVFDYNFYLKNYLFEGDTYYLEIGVYNLEDDETVWLETCVDTAEYAVSAEITQMPYNTEVFYGAESESLNLEGLEMEFTLSDGRVIEWNWKDYDYVEGSMVYWDYNWTDDDEFYVYFACDEAYIEIPFTTLENPVESIEFTPARSEYIEGCDGDYDENGNFIYNLDYSDDDMITISYKDGSSVTQPAWDYTEDGYYADAYHYQYSKPWTVGGNNCYYVEFLGHTVEVPVTIIENPIDHISVTKDPDVTIYEGYYYPKWQGAEISLFMKDGSVKKTVVTDDNLEYRNKNAESFVYIVHAGAYEVEICYNYDEEHGEYYTLECLNNTHDYYGFEFIEGRDITDYEISRINYDGDQIVIDVEYNLEAETFKFEDILVSDEFIDVDGNFGYSWGYVDTQNGIAYYSVEPDEVSGYILWFLGDYRYAQEDKYVETYMGLLGDANGDNVVNIRDATAVQKYSAGLISMSEEEILFGDADGNGDLNVRDATAIQKYVAGIYTGFDIGESLTIEK